MTWILLALAAASGASPGPCRIDTASLIELAPAQFDQDMQGGWRPIADKPECRTAAADLLAAYRKAHWATLRPGELHINYWHEGQLRAALGENDRAVALLMSGVGPDSLDGFDDYAIGTVAFLKRDLGALKSARDRLARLPEPAGFDKQAAEFKSKYKFEIHWPPNLDVLDGLIACYDKPYSVAYGGDCRPKLAEGKPPAR